MKSTKQRTQYPMGSVSCATMRVEDLIPTFVYELQTRRRQRTLRKSQSADLREIERRMDQDSYYESDDADFDLEWLFDALNEYAAPYFYFGAHPGDGADYGYWLSEEWDQDAVIASEIMEGCEQQGDMLLKVSDLSEIPSKYRGEVAVVNDHGNVTLYVKTCRTLREVWGVV
jgi:hypothetical protein